MASYVLLLAACGVALALGEITDPGAHQVNLNNLNFILDDQRQSIVMVTDSGCYVYKLTRDQYIDVGNPGGLNSLEKPLLNALINADTYRRMQDNDVKHFSADIQKACSSKLLFEVHEPHKAHN